MSYAPTRTTVYLVGRAADVLAQVKVEYRDRYGIATTVSAVFARLLLGESIDEVIRRPYRDDLARIASESDSLRQELRRARTKSQTTDLRRIHRDIAALFPRTSQISHTLHRAKRRNEPHSPDFAEAERLKETLNDLMDECGEAIAPRRRR